MSCEPNPLLPESIKSNPCLSLNMKSFWHISSCFTIIVKFIHVLSFYYQFLLFLFPGQPSPTDFNLLLRIQELRLLARLVLFCSIVFFYCSLPLLFSSIVVLFHCCSLPLLFSSIVFLSYDTNPNRTWMGRETWKNI